MPNFTKYQAPTELTDMFPARKGKLRRRTLMEVPAWGLHSTQVPPGFSRIAKRLSFVHWLEIACRSRCDYVEHRATRTPNSIDVWMEIIILEFHWWSPILILLLTFSLFALVGFREDHCIAGLPLGLFPDAVRSLFRRAGLCSGQLVNGHFFNSKLASIHSRYSPRERS